MRIYGGVNKFPQLIVLSELLQSNLKALILSEKFSDLLDESEETGFGQIPENPREQDSVSLWKRKLLIASSIASGLEFLHSKGYGHGNLSASKVLFGLDMTEVKISFYGGLEEAFANQLSKSSSSSLEEKDLFDLGVVLLELFLGKLLGSNTTSEGLLIYWILGIISLQSLKKNRADVEGTLEKVSIKRKNKLLQRTQIEFLEIVSKLCQPNAQSRPKLSIVLLLLKDLYLQISSV